MLRRRTARGRNDERGVVVLLVAVVLLFVVAAMAALAIDLVTFYTARSEAQMAADGAALAGARVLANSGMTSDPITDPNHDALVSSAESLASTIADQVALDNKIGGQVLKLTDVNVTFNSTDPTFGTNPHVTVRVQRTDLPTFFARIWGRGTVTVKATATAEAYNPSGTAALGVPTFPVTQTCVKPWLLPNIDPSNPTPPNPIFNPLTGAVQTNTLLGHPSPGTTPSLHTACFNCNQPPTLPTPVRWHYYPGDPGDFPPPNASSVVCPGCITPYQLSIAGCVPTSIACDARVHIDVSSYAARDTETGIAGNAMTHANANAGDRIDTATLPSPPFQFLTGDDNPVVQSGAIASGTDVTVSDSLVTVPVINADPINWPPPNFPEVQIIGFVQLFLNPTGQASPANGHIRTTVVNLVGCGTSATGQPILGNGASAVPVRLITPP